MSDEQQTEPLFQQDEVDLVQQYLFDDADPIAQAMEHLCAARRAHTAMVRAGDGMANSAMLEVLTESLEQAANILDDYHNMLYFVSSGQVEEVEADAVQEDKRPDATEITTSLPRMCKHEGGLLVTNCLRTKCDAARQCAAESPLTYDQQVH